jgi:hypothetical protein
MSGDALLFGVWCKPDTSCDSLFYARFEVRNLSVNGYDFFCLDCLFASIPNRWGLFGFGQCWAAYLLPGPWIAASLRSSQ